MSTSAGHGWQEAAIASIAPWPGNPRVNIQKDQGMAKTYQVRQVLKGKVARR